MGRRASRGTRFVGDRSRSGQGPDRRHVQAFGVVADRQRGGQSQRNGTELFVIRARIFGRVLEDVGRAGGEAAVREHPHLDIRRVDIREVREATGPKLWPGLEGRR